MLDFSAVAAAFCLFIIYDINSVVFRKKVLQPLFFTGCLLLAFATGYGMLISVRAFQPSLLRVCVCGAPALACMGLLVHTLFFAIPFSSTYVEQRSETDKPKVCKCGVYGLCRHPGVLCLAGLCICLACMVPTVRMAALCAAICLLNVLYAWFQDVWTFPRTFCDYAQYRQEVSFLLPGIKRTDSK